MTIDKAQLRALAEAATKGDRELWDSKTIDPMGVLAIPVAIPSQMVVLCNVLGSFSPLHDSYVGAASYRKDAEFIAAVTPAVVLGLLAEIEQLKGCDQAYAEAWEKARDLQSEMDEVVAERDTLRAELAGLRTGYDAQNNVIAGLKAENEAMRIAMKELCAMYTHVWDREDGSLVCFSSNVERFDKAHEAAWALLTGKEASHE